MIGGGFSFANPFAEYDPVEPMTSYRNEFRPSAALAKPHAILALAAVAADTDAEAERLAATIDLNFVRRARGEDLPPPSPPKAAAHHYPPEPRERLPPQTPPLVVGAPANML